MKRHFKAVLSCILCVGLFAGCTGQKEIVARGFAMDTVVSITVYRDEDEKIAQQALQLLDDWEQQCSADREDATIYKINQGQSQTVSCDVLEMLTLGQALEEQTQGAFSLMVRPLVELWHIQSRQAEEALPNEEQIQQAKSLCGQKYLQVQENSNGTGTVSVEQGSGLDLGSIAKGKAAEIIKDYVQEQGVQNALIDLGGNICTVGDKTYQIGIQDPRDEQFVFATLQVQNKSVVTSGDYQRYVEISGTRYHHILDIRTGSPAQSGLISVTIVGEDSMVCDALSTAVFLLGEEQGLALVKAYGVEAVLVNEDKQVTVTDGLKDSFTLQRQDYTIK